MEETKNENGDVVDVLCSTCMHAERVHIDGHACVAAVGLGHDAMASASDTMCLCVEFVRSQATMRPNVPPNGEAERGPLEVTRRGRFVRVCVGARLVALFDTLEVSAYVPARATSWGLNTAVHMRGGLVIMVPGYAPDEVCEAVEQR